MVSRSIAVLLALVVAPLAAGCAAQADEPGDVAVSQDALTARKHYLLMFGYEDARNSAPLSHTFATFLRADFDGPGTANGRIVDQVDISWLPERFTGSVCVDALHLRCPPETGHNYSLNQTLGFAQAGRLRVAMWGPYEITGALFDRAKDQERYLDSGKSQYVANDLFLHRRAYDRRGGALNCMHAVSDIAFFDRTGLNWGVRGSKIVLDNLRGYIVSPARADWVLPRIGLDTSGIDRLSL